MTEPEAGEEPEPQVPAFLRWSAAVILGLLGLAGLAVLIATIMAIAAAAT